MGDRLLNFLENIRNSLWLIPTGMFLLAILTAMVTLRTDGWLTAESPDLDLPWWVFTGSPEAARQILSTVSGSMISMAGLVFSITIVALTLASQQYGPRLLRNFIQDRGNQLVLGTFIATFIYNLMILRSVRGWQENVFIPQVSITFAIFTAFASLLVLIYFIHHISKSIQAEYLIDKVGDELEAVIRHVYPASSDHPEADNEREKIGEFINNLVTESIEIPSLRSGYLQTVDYGALVKLAVKENLVIRMTRHAGHYLIPSHSVASVFPAPADVEAFTSEFNEALLVGKRRTPTQDVEFAIDSLVEIALRALSPSMNDPFTAIACIDRLSEGLTLLSQRPDPLTYLFDKKGVLRVMKITINFEDAVNRAFHQIRQSAAHMPAITIHMLQQIAIIAECVQNEEDLAVLRHHAQLVEEASRKATVADFDCHAVVSEYQQTLQTLLTVLR